MVARRPVNLTRRKGVYYFRGFIRVAMRESARRRELRVSLRTRDDDIARARVQRAALAFSSLCGQRRLMIQAHAPDQNIFDAVQAFGRALIANASPPPVFDGLMRTTTMTASSAAQTGGA